MTVFFRLTSLRQALVVSCVMFCASVGFADTIIFDDFSDGDPFDDNPVTWLGPSTDREAGITIEDGSLVVQTVGEIGGDAKVLDIFLGDTSFRTQGRLTEGGSIGLVARRAQFDSANYWAGIDQKSMSAYIGRGGGGGKNLGEAPIEFDVFQNELTLQLDVIGNKIDFWVWPADEPMPLRPTVSASDDSLASGDIYLWVGGEDLFTGGAWWPAAGEFRFVHVADEHISGASRLTVNGAGETYFQDFDSMGTSIGRAIPQGWQENGSKHPGGLGLTDGFLTEPGSDNDGVLGVLNLGGNAESFGPATEGFIPTWTAELGGANDRFGRDDVIADNASDRALGVSRENNDDAGQLNFEIEIVDATLRAFVLDWDLEIWGGDPDADFRSPEGPGMKVDVSIGGTSYHTMAENLLPGIKFDSSEDESGSVHNPTLIDGNVHSIRNISSGIKEVGDADGAVGNMVQINFNSNWNGATDDGANGWFSAVDNVRLRALAPGDADANGVVDVADLLTLLGGQKFNKGVDGVTWAQGDFNADDQFNTGDLLAMLAYLSGQFPSDPYASEAGNDSDEMADVIVNSATGEITIDLAGHTTSAIIIGSAAEIFNGEQPNWDTTSQFPSTLPGELGNVLFTSTASGVDELGVVISNEFLGRDKEFYLNDLDLSILIASEGGALTKGNVIVVPEPSSWMLLLIGTLLVGWRQGATR